ncbi:hypothetical protein BDD12DRAFT_809534 [Trichophaea hybrida]|nr:hypothetical protein BDD12DRAFT_809534 [Trichophaea hybrida]
MVVSPMFRVSEVLHRSNTSIWILIQIPSGTRCNMERLNREGEGSPPADHPMAIHLFLLYSCEKNWGPYIGYLGDELSLMGYAEFNLDVSHSQRLTLLRRKLQDARSLLESNLEVASTLSEHAEEMQQQGVVLPGVNGRFQSEVRQYQLRLRCHIGNVKKHLDCSDDIRLLVNLHVFYVLYPKRTVPGY